MPAAEASSCLRSAPPSTGPLKLEEPATLRLSVSVDQRMGAGQVGSGSARGRRGWSMATRVIALVLVLCAGLACRNQGGAGPVPELSRISDSDPTAAKVVSRSDIVVVGELREVLYRGCGVTGLGMVREMMLFDVVQRLKGDSYTDQILVAVPLLGGPLERVEDGCNQLNTDVFRPGRKYIIACTIERGMWTPTEWFSQGDLWADGPEARSAVLRLASPPHQKLEQP